MKKIMFAIALAFASFGVTSTAYATDVNCAAIDGTKLSDDTYANSVKALCNKTAPSITPEKVREWGGIAKEFSGAVVQTAQGLGIAVNDFLRTPAGVMVAFYFMWKVIGGIVIGVPLLIITWSLYFWAIRRYINGYSRVEYENHPVLFGLWNRKTIVKIEAEKTFDGETLFSIILFLAPFVFLSVLILLVILN